MQLSVHVFPVFDSSREAQEAYVDSALQSRDGSYAARLSGNSLSAATAAVACSLGASGLLVLLLRNWATYHVFASNPSH
jgi:hypothetical protein